MRKSSAVKVLAPVRRGEREPVERVYLSVRVTPEQKGFLARLGDGSLSVGLDRAVAAAAAQSGAAR